MTKRELLAALADLPDDAEIFLNTTDDDTVELLTVELESRQDRLGRLMSVATLSDLTPGSRRNRRR